MRLDPKLKYLAEIASRKQRRSLANFIEWAIDEALANVKLVEGLDVNGPFQVSLREVGNKLWDLEPSDRLIKLAESYPDLLTYEEQIIWKAIFEISATDSYKDDTGATRHSYHRFVYGEGAETQADRAVIKDCWPTLVAYSVGNATEEDLVAELKNTISFLQ
jgi:hypothetical protein